MAWRFIDLGKIDCFLGPALFEAMMQVRREEKIPDTLFFWQPERPAVYIGYHQLAREEANLDECAKAGVPIIRRVLGGGAGYCDADQILYNLIYAEGGGIPRGPANSYRFILPGLIEALHIMGLDDACIDKERFGVYVNGKKVSGSGQLSSDGVVNSGGSFLVDFNYAAMGRCLRNPVKNLKNGVLRPEDGLTTVRRELGAANMDEAKKALRSGFEKILGKTVDGELTEYEIGLAGGFRKKYLEDDWTFRSDLRKEKKEKGRFSRNPP